MNVRPTIPTGTTSGGADDNELGTVGKLASLLFVPAFGGWEATKAFVTRLLPWAKTKATRAVRHAIDFIKAPIVAIALRIKSAVAAAGRFVNRQLRHLVTVTSAALRAVARRLIDALRTVWLPLRRRCGGDRGGSEALCR